jgi:hypothetical protein
MIMWRSDDNGADDNDDEVQVTGEKTVEYEPEEEEKVVKEVSRKARTTADKGKGKEKAMMEVDEGENEKEEDGDEDEEEMEMGGTTTTINRMDTICNEAIITICRIDIQNPPAPIDFGEWNKRSLDEKEAKKLASEMIKSRFGPFAYGNMLPLIIKREKLDPSCIKKTLDAEAAPLLRLTEEALEEGITLQLAGGRHRLRATEILRERSLKMIGALENKIAALKEAEKKGKKEGVIGHLERMHAEERALYCRLGVWGVIVYDEGESKQMY